MVLWTLCLSYYLPLQYRAFAFLITNFTYEWIAQRFVSIGLLTLEIQKFIHKIFDVRPKKLKIGLVVLEEDIYIS